MASTNKTTNYELSQYVGSDKPSYLNDYNQDMSRIDLGIHAAKSEADTNATAIGTLSSLTTTDKSDLVSAINEVDSEASTANSTAVQADGKADTNATAIGTLANLTTTSKTNLVGAINEVNGNVGTLSSLSTTEKTSTVGAINEVLTRLSNFNMTSFKRFESTDYTITNAVAGGHNLNLAKNSDGSLCKFYGQIGFYVNSTQSTAGKLVIHNTGLTPTSEFTVIAAGLYNITDTATREISRVDITFKTNGDLEINLPTMETGKSYGLLFFGELIWVKDFGDDPQ